jgi:hypothetical protein
MSLLPTNGSATTPQDFFGLSSPSVPNDFNKGNFQLPTFNPPEFGSSLHSTSHTYSLGLDPLSQHGQNAFGVDSAYHLLKQANQPLTGSPVQPKQPKVEDHAAKLFLDTSAVAVHKLHPLGLAIDAGKALHEVVKAAQDHEKNKISMTAVITCKAAGEAVEMGISTGGSGLIFGGIPAYIAAMPENPALILTIPKVVESIPPAFAFVEETAKKAGDAVNEECLNLFSTFGKKEP